MTPQQRKAQIIEVYGTIDNFLIKVRLKTPYSKDSLYAARMTIKKSGYYLCPRKELPFILQSLHIKHELNKLHITTNIEQFYGK